MADAGDVVYREREVRLMPPQFVKPHVKSQKKDAADAEAICEAVQRQRCGRARSEAQPMPGMTFTLAEYPFD
jgi:transposase